VHRRLIPQVFFGIRDVSTSLGTEVVEQVCSRVVILRHGRIVGHDSVANLRTTLQLPSLDAVFAALTAEDNVEERSQALIAAMKA